MNHMNIQIDQIWKELLTICSMLFPFINILSDLLKHSAKVEQTWITFDFFFFYFDDISGERVHFRKVKLISFILILFFFFQPRYKTYLFTYI